MNMQVIWLTGALLLVVCAANGAPVKLSEKALKPAVERYLAAKGDFCLGKFDWPIVVTEADRRHASRDALQMPVLEKLGLVVSTDASNDTSVRSYDLTPGW